MLSIAQSLKFICDDVFLRYDDRHVAYVPEPAGSCILA